ncbi:MAG: amino acid ABC transporter substrate-binding protein [Lactobacillus sp.]|nr:amino acid ABC transporter substrate-binding protein [Lactobacillus sp.]MDN6052801.1 amino acid ABC transporter substrate-binding protein [Lactobacillus sp.]
MKQLRRLWLLLTVLSLGISLTACEGPVTRANTTDTWGKINQQKKVIIGLDDTFVPMGFRAKNGQLVGYDIDLARAVFKLYGIHVDFQAIDWSMNAAELRNGTIDLIWNGYSITPQRRKKVAFPTPYLNNDQVLVSMRHQRIRSFKDMTGKTLGVQTGSSGANDLDTYPQRLKQYIKAGTPILYDSFTDALIDLKAKRIQGLLIDSSYANYYIQHEANPHAYRQIIGNFPKEQFGVGLRKGDRTLRQKINHGLKRLAHNGTLARINRKWFGQQVDSPLLKSLKAK